MFLKKRILDSATLSFLSGCILSQLEHSLSVFGLLLCNYVVGLTQVETSLVLGL